MPIFAINQCKRHVNSASSWRSHRSNAEIYSPWRQNTVSSVHGFDKCAPIFCSLDERITRAVAPPLCQKFRDLLWFQTTDLRCIKLETILSSACQSHDFRTMLNGGEENTYSKLHSCTFHSLYSCIWHYWGWGGWRGKGIGEGAHWVILSQCGIIILWSFYLTA